MKGHPRPWGQKLLAGSWRTVPFYVVSHALDGGRRLAVHELPQRDDALVEDLGRRQRRFQVEMLGLGPDYFYWRDELREALDESGPGLLVHPWLGEIQCCVESYSLSESVSEGGQFRVRVTFVEATSTLRVVTEVDYAGKTRSAANEVAEAIPEAFVQMSIGEDLSTPLARLADELEAIVRRIEAEQAAVAECVAQVLSFAAQAESLAALPMQAAAATIAVIQSAAALLTDITGGASAGVSVGGLATSALSLGASWPQPAAGLMSSPPPWNSETASAAQLRLARDQSAVLLLARAAFCSAIASAAVEAEYAVAEDALFAEQRLDALVEGTLEDVAVPYALRRALTALRDSSERFLRTSIADLPRRLRYTPEATLPTIVIAQRLYGDADRASEITRLNGLSNPLFAPGGRALEVLSGN